MYQCLVFGVGSAYMRRRLLINYDYIELIGVLDNDCNKWGTFQEGLLIDNPVNIHNYKFDYILITSTYFNEIQQQLYELGINKDKIINLYSIIKPISYGRSYISNSYLKYEEGYQYGIEIGGGNHPLRLLDKRIKIKQVDYCDHNLQYDYYHGMSLVKVDIIDDGEKLESFKGASLDFIIACHMLEHCRNPIGTIRNFLLKLKDGGIIFLAIPDKRYTFDKGRMLTTMDHLILDDREPNAARDKSHYFDKEVELLTDEEERQMNVLLERDERIHFHVWDTDSCIEFIYQTKKYLGNSFTIEQMGNLSAANDIICVLRKK